MRIRLRRASPAWPGSNGVITKRISRIVSAERRRAKESGVVGIEKRAYEPARGVAWVLVGGLVLAPPPPGRGASRWRLQRPARHRVSLGAGPEGCENNVEWVERRRRMVEQVEGQACTMIQYARQKHERTWSRGRAIYLGLVSSLSDQTTAILGQVQWIGFNLDRTPAAV